MDKVVIGLMVCVKAKFVPILQYNPTAKVAMNNIQ